MDRKRTSQVTTGLLMIALGLLFLGQRLNLLPDMDFRQLWPAFLVVVGVAKFLAPDEDGHRGSGAWMIFLGGLGLLHTYHIFRLADSWPLLIVAGGVSIVFGRRGANPRVMAARPVDARPAGSDHAPSSGAPMQGDGHV